MSKYFYNLVCFPTFSKCFIECFTRKYDAECAYRRISSTVHLDEAYIEKCKRVILKHFDVVETIPLIEKENENETFNNFSI